MAQRFGRNRRRAAREAIAALDDKVWQMQDAITREAQKRAGVMRERDELRALLDDVIDRIKSACGPNSALLPIDFAGKQNGYPGPRYPIYPPVSPAFDPSARMTDYTVSYHVEQLLHLILMVEYDPHRYARLLRFFDTSDKRGVNRAMVISQSALDVIGITKRDREYMARDIAEQLAAPFNRKAA